MGSLRVGHDSATSLSLFTFYPLQCSCLENPRDGGAWWAASIGLHRVGHDRSDLAATAAAANYMLLQIALFHFYLWLGNILLFVCTMSSLSIPLSMDI